MTPAEIAEQLVGERQAQDKGAKMEPHLPIYHRPPNKFLRYEARRFDDGAGHTGTKRIALYQDKNGKQREETAQVIWDAPNG